MRHAPLPMFAAAAALASVLVTGAAQAAPPGIPEPASLPEPTSESSWDIPGWFVVDGVDSLLVDKNAVPPRFRVEHQVTVPA